MEILKCPPALKEGKNASPEARDQYEILAKKGEGLQRIVEAWIDLPESLSVTQH